MQAGDDGAAISAPVAHPMRPPDPGLRRARPLAGGNRRWMTGPIWHGRGYARMRHALTWAPDRPGAGPSRYAALAGAITRTGGWVATLAVRLARVTLEAAEGRCRACRHHGDARAVPAVLEVVAGAQRSGGRRWRVRSGYGCFRAPDGGRLSPVRGPAWVRRHRVQRPAAAAAGPAAARRVGPAGARDVHRPASLRVLPYADRCRQHADQRGAAAGAAADGDPPVRADARPVGSR